MPRRMICAVKHPSSTDAIDRLCHNSSMGSNEHDFYDDTIEDEILIAEAMHGVPDFYEIPDEQREIIEKATLTKERMFWLRATHIEKTIATQFLLRRAVYAESRCWEMENMAAEMALITSGAAERVRELEKQLEFGKVKS